MLIIYFVLSLQTQPPRLVIASAFDREYDVADIKIHEAENVADRIVFCESDKTQSGYPRPQRLPRIKHELIETYRTTCYSDDWDYKLGWKCENAPRMCAARHACEGEPNSTIVVLSDLDEIIDRDALKRLKRTPFPSNAKFDLGARMAVFMYGFFGNFRGGGILPPLPISVVTQPLPKPFYFHIFLVGTVHIVFRWTNTFQKCTLCLKEMVGFP